MCAKFLIFLGTWQPTTKCGAHFWFHVKYTANCEAFHFNFSGIFFAFFDFFFTFCASFFRYGRFLASNDFNTWLNYTMWIESLRKIGQTKRSAQIWNWLEKYSLLLFVFWIFSSPASHHSLKINRSKFISHS